MAIMVPTVHNNGTGKDALLDQATAACAAVQTLLGALREMTPNGRDYYPQGDAAFRKAQAEHDARVRWLLDFGKDLDALSCAIDDGGHKITA